VVEGAVHVWWSEEEAFHLSFFKSMTKESQKFLCDNFVPVEVRKINLIKIEKSRRWKLAFLSISRLVC
jgi:hypothetical protein